MSASKPVSRDPMAIVPYSSQSSEEFLVSEQERVTNEIFKRTLENAKFETAHLIPLDLDHQTVLNARSRRLEHLLPSLITGPYPIGHAEMVVDTSRTASDLMDDKIGIEIYAPTSQKHGKKLFMLRDNDNFARNVFSEEQIQSLFTNSYDELEIDQNRPIIIFSHGYGCDPIRYRILLENLASHGYIVLALNHPSSSGYVPFSKKLIDTYDFTTMPPEEEKVFHEKLALVHVNNIRFIIEKIRRNDLIPDLDSSNTPIILAGHSLGGEASIIVANNDPKIAGCINLDGLAGNKENRVNGLKRTPVLTVLSDKKWIDSEKDVTRLKEYQQDLKDWETFHKNSMISYKFMVDDANHMDFASYYPILDWLFGDDNYLKNALKTHHVTSDLMLNFMKTIL